MNLTLAAHPILRDQENGEGSNGGTGSMGVERSASIFQAGTPDGVDPKVLQRGHNYVHEGSETGSTEGQGEPNEGQQQQQQSQQQQQKPAVQPTLTPELIASIVRESSAAALQAAQPPQQQQQQQQPFTPERIFEMFKFPKVDAAGFKQLFGVDPDTPAQVTALNKIFQDVGLAVMRMADFRQKSALDSTISELQKKYEPLAQHIQQSRATAEEQRFFSKFNELEPHRNIVLMVRAQALQQGLKFPTAEAAEEYLATTTKATLQKLGVQLSAKNGQGSAARPTGQSKLTTTNVGGHSSHGRGNHTAAPKTVMDKSIAIFQTGNP